MRICFLVWEYPPALVGGLGTYAEYVTRKYVEMGHDVTVFTLNPGNMPTREIIKGVEVHRPLIVNASTIFSIVLAEDVKKWGTNIKFFNDVFLYNIMSSAKLINELVRKDCTKYDIVCMHDWLSTIAGVTIKSESNIPTVFHVHSTEWGRSGGRGSDVVNQLELVGAKRCDRIITVSNCMKIDLTVHGWPEDKIDVVWNGVDPEVYNPALFAEEEKKDIRKKYGLKDDEKMILFVGRLTWIKGVRNLVQAMPQILGEFPKVKLVNIRTGRRAKGHNGVGKKIRYN